MAWESLDTNTRYVLHAEDDGIIIDFVHTRRRWRMRGLSGVMFISDRAAIMIILDAMNTGYTLRKQTIWQQTETKNDANNSAN